MNTRFRKSFYQSPMDDGSTGSTGAGAGDVAAPVAEVVAAAPEVAAPVAPTSMLDAISAGLDESASLAGQPRDELGRFAAKQAAEAAAAAAGIVPVAPVAAAAAVAEPVVPAKVLTPEEEMLQMPEGLSPKGQERFQKLANSVKEVSAERDQYKSTFESFQTVLHQNGVQQEQFQQAVGLLGMLNAGDLQGYQRGLMQELRTVALMTGQPMTTIDPLENHPDLRQAVDQLQIPENLAIEQARLRMQNQNSQNMQRRQQEQQQVQQTQQQAENVRQDALRKVDALCQHLKATDMDFPAIEAKLLPIMPQLVDGMPPEKWETAFKTQYALLKQMAGGARQVVPGVPASQPLRATGQPSPGAVPKTMHEAMWGQR